MKNPVLAGTGYRVYITIWAIVMIAHFFVVYSVFSFPLRESLLDAIVYNGLFAFMVPGFWYIVKFAGLNRDYLTLFSMHLGAALITVFLWILCADLLVRVFVGRSETYLELTTGSFVWRVIIGFMFYTVSVLIFYLVRYYEDLQEKSGRELELQNLLRETELRMLRSQINPHFIFNSLNSISALTIAQPEKAQDMVVKLSTFLRTSLGKDNASMIEFHEEVANISLYLDIEKVRFGERLVFYKDIEKSCEKTQVPNLILQPLVENAIKHGVHESTEPVVIRLDCQKGDEFMTIRLSNTYDQDSISRKGEGIGLENVKRRLAKIYEVNDLAQVIREQDTFTVQIKIPNNSP
jgi:sensor histidine kinase YesM